MWLPMCRRSWSLPSACVGRSRSCGVTLSISVLPSGSGLTLERAAAELRYPDARQPVTKTGEVDRAVKELLGLDYKQFTQIAMIAQGQFRKFLDTNTDERSKIFRELFHTEFYQSLQERLKREALDK